MRRTGIFLVLAICVLTMQGCTAGENQNTDAIDVEEDKIQIGLSFDSFIIERWQRDRDVFVSKAMELGAEVNVQNANGDIEEQISQIEYLIDKKMDVITIIAIDGEALTDVVKKAKKAGIKIIAYDRLIKNSNVDLYISFDNEKVGALMGESIKENLPGGGNIIMISGSPTDNNVSMVEKGFYNAIGNTNINVVRKEYAPGWLAETAFNFTNESLKLTNNIDGIMCGNDSLAGQAIRALAERRKAGSVCVVGQDADLDACQRIVEGTQTMTVYKPVERLAKSAAEFAVSLAENEEITTTGTINDGTYDVAYEKLEPIAVNKENMDEVIIADGFHLEEEVYLNIPK